MLRLLYFGIIFSGLVSAQEIEVIPGAAGQLTLKASSCELLKSQRNSLCEWKAKVEKVIHYPPTVTCKRVPTYKFVLNVGDCLPTSAKAEHSKRLFNEGPNCWGTAMRFHKLSVKPRFMWPEEMMYWLDSPICRKLGEGEVKSPGDVISIFGPEYLQEGEYQAKDPGINFWPILYPKRTNMTVASKEGYTGYQRLIHSVIFISDELAFGKDSPAKDDRFYFHSMEEVYGRPRKNEKDCQENQSRTPHLRENGNSPKDFSNSVKCNYFSIAHRCTDFEKFFEENVVSEEDKEILKNIRSMQAIQTKLFSLVTTQTRMSTSSQIQNYLRVSDLNLKNAEQELKKSVLPKTKEMLLVQQYFTAAAIRKSLSQAGLASE